MVLGEKAQVVDDATGRQGATRVGPQLVGVIEGGEHGRAEHRGRDKVCKGDKLAVLLHKRYVLAIGQQDIYLGMACDGSVIVLHKAVGRVRNQINTDVIGLLKSGVYLVVIRGVSGVGVVYHQ